MTIKGPEIYQTESIEIVELRDVLRICFKPQIPGDFRGEQFCMYRLCGEWDFGVEIQVMYHIKQSFSDLCNSDLKLVTDFVVKCFLI